MPIERVYTGSNLMPILTLAMFVTIRVIFANQIKFHTFDLEMKVISRRR